MPGTHTNLLYHLVFSTKLRKPFITEAIREELYRYIGGIVRGEGGVLLEIGGMPDHVHLLARLMPTIALADLLRQLKANSSKWINEKHSRLRKFGWQDGYAAFTVSESQVARVSQYIRNQHQHHRTSDFKSELVALLRRHRVEFDERYLDG
ncbi:MAG: IS200/IS605 family transposase [Planctomycetia bacterium]|nr:IS200/IS605 family transposase [Planctomycetia bacterium]